MKPRTKLQKRLCEIQEQLPPLSQEVIQYAYANGFQSYFVESRNRLFCLDCGHKFQSPFQQNWMNDVTCECPSCGKELKRISEGDVVKTGFWSRDGYSRSTEYQKHAHMAILSVADGMQLTRILYVNKIMKKKQPAQYWCKEVIHQFITEIGKMETFAMISSYSASGWASGTKIELRETFDNDERYRIAVDMIYPKKKLLPIFKRNGFTGAFHGMNPSYFLYRLLRLPRFETLLKTKQISLLKYYGHHPHDIEYRWNSIKICIRNGYKVKDASMWIDYMDMLETKGKDLRNAKFVCPEDLKQAHNKLMREREARSRAEEERRRRESERIKSEGLERDSESYIKRMGRFFHLQLIEGDLTVEPIRSVKEMQEEGQELAHCVYTNEYYNKKDSLILTAKVHGNRSETIEVSLSNYEIVQARGYNNEPTNYHKRIVDLVERNMKLIKRMHRTNDNKENGTHKKTTQSSEIQPARLLGSLPIHTNGADRQEPQNADQSMEAGRYGVAHPVR